jgi:membrane associated rhomboid family serine protease
MGAYLVLFPNRRVHALVPGLRFGTVRVSALVMLGMWFVLQLLNGLLSLSEDTAQTGGVAIWAHVGGFVAGLLIGLLLRGRAPSRQQALSR